MYIYEIVSNDQQDNFVHVAGLPATILKANTENNIAKLKIPARVKPLRVINIISNAVCSSAVSLIFIV